MTDVLVAAIRELHAPTDDFYLRCDGCDADGYEADSPEWPCRTANIVYTPEEVDGALDRARERREARRAQPSAEPKGPAESLIPSIWGQQIAAMLTASPLTQVIINREHP